MKRNRYNPYEKLHSIKHSVNSTSSTRLRHIAHRTSAMPMRHRHRMAESPYGGSALALAASFVVALAVPVAVPVPHDTAIKTGMQKHVDVHAE